MAETQLKEKKVEYIELIYDLIFVYLIGKSATFLDRVEAGFISFTTITQYLASSLIFIQIWYHTTLYINRYGKNSLRETVMLMINMFLLYIMGATTSLGWNVNYTVFASAWALILINIGVNYVLELKTADEFARLHIRQNLILLFVQAALILASIPFYSATGYAVGVWTMVLGFCVTPFLRKVPVNFAHLSERVMLYVVLTFGEMIVIVAEYFTDGFSFQTYYYALMSFLIVSGLFFSYGFVYDRLLDRQGEITGNGYMLLHVFMIAALSFVTTSLEFLRQMEIRDFPKTVMMLVSLFVYFFCLALTERWSKRRFHNRGRFMGILISEFIVFALACLLFMGNGYVCIAIMAAYIYLQLAALFLSDRHSEEKEEIRDSNRENEITE